jgi:hypothetical protein
LDEFVVQWGFSFGFGWAVFQFVLGCESEFLQVQGVCSIVAGFFICLLFFVSVLAWWEDFGVLPVFDNIFTMFTGLYFRFYAVAGFRVSYTC